MAGENADAPARMALWPALKLVWRYSLFERGKAMKLFDDRAFDRIERAIAEGESTHRGEIRFAFEGDLTLADARRCCAPRERALIAFAMHGIWDTAENSGILIFLQWPLHGVEIIADRGVAAKVKPQHWDEAIARISQACTEARPVDGVIEAIVTLHRVLAEAMPAEGDDPDELPNRPIRL